MFGAVTEEPLITTTVRVESVAPLFGSRIDVGVVVITILLAFTPDTVPVLVSINTQQPQTVAAVTGPWQGILSAGHVLFGAVLVGFTLPGTQPTFLSQFDLDAQPGVTVFVLVTRLADRGQHLPDLLFGDIDGVHGRVNRGIVFVRIFARRVDSGILAGCLWWRFVVPTTQKKTGHQLTGYPQRKSFSA